MFKDVDNIEFKHLLSDKIDEYLSLSNQSCDEHKLMLIIDKLQYYLQKKQYKNLILMEFEYIFEQAALGKWKEKRISFQNVYSWFNEFYDQKVKSEEYRQIHEEFKNPLSRLDNSLFAKALNIKIIKAMQLKEQEHEFYKKILDIPLKSIFENLKTNNDPFYNLL